MIDFTSARFLGVTRRTPSRPPNLGKPATLAEPPGAARLARFVADSQGAEDALVARSALHALQDALAATASDMPVLLDEHCYPIARWAARAVCEGGTMHDYRHHDYLHVDRLLNRLGRPAVVVTDAWCAGCLRPAPLAGLLAAATAHRGLLVVDDSLAFGVLGPGGAGTPRWCGVSHARLLWVASAGKAYGTPLALITGPAEQIERIRRYGPHRVHSSPAATGDIAELTEAIVDQRTPMRRHRALANARHLRLRASSLRVRTLGAPLPVVGFVLEPSEAPRAMHSLRRQGVVALPLRSECLRLPKIALCVRADHTAADLDTAAAAMADALAKAA